MCQRSLVGSSWLEACPLPQRCRRPKSGHPPPILGLQVTWEVWECKTVGFPFQHSFYPMKRPSLWLPMERLAQESLFLFAGFEHKITVQASPTLDKRKGSDGASPPASPSIIPRLRAIRREYLPRPWPICHQQTFSAHICRECTPGGTGTTGTRQAGSPPWFSLERQNKQTNKSVRRTISYSGKCCKGEQGRE